LGTVEKGKLADLAIVNGDPLADIAVLREAKNIALVVKDGAIAASRMAGR
jgi:imidazolonepropionase-like amidohydrolase